MRAFFTVTVVVMLAACSGSRTLLGVDPLLADGGAGGTGDAGTGGAGAGTGGAASVSAGCGAQLTSPSPLCTAGASCPVVVDATLTCRERDPFRPTVAPAPGDAGYVMLTARVSGVSIPFHPQLIHIDPAAAAAPTVDMDPIQAVFTRVVTDAAGVPSIFGDEVGGLAVAYATHASAGWTVETISPADKTQYFLGGAALAADGRAFALFAPSDTGPLSLGTRAATGGWTLSTVSSTHIYNAEALALTTTGQVYVAYETPSTASASGEEALQLQQGTSPPQLVTAFASNGSSAKVDVVAPAGGAPVLSTDLPVAGGGIHVFVPGAAAGAYTDLAVPATIVQNPTGCENAGCASNGNGQTTCTETADTTFAAAQALASTADGAVYFAFTRRHVDRDAHFETMLPMTEGVPTCDKIIDADRSRTQLILARVSTGANAALTESLHIDLANLDTGVEIDAGARGQRLYLVVLGSTGGRYFVLDTTKLP